MTHPTPARAVERPREDFDRLARLAPDCWTPTDHYLPRLLALVPDDAREALDVGCGTGRFARLLAQRGAHVVGLDFSPNAIELARRRSSEHDSIAYVCADAQTWAWPESAFDAVTCLTTLHHLPLEPTLARMARALRPGGTLLIHDILHHSRRTPTGLAAAGLGAIGAATLSRVHARRNHAALRGFWRDHARDEHYLDAADLRRIATTDLPGAVVRRHLMFRYTLTWDKSSKAAEQQSSR